MSCPVSAPELQSPATFPLATPSMPLGRGSSRLCRDLSGFKSAKYVRVYVYVCVYL